MTRRLLCLFFAIILSASLRAQDDVRPEFFAGAYDTDTTTGEIVYSGSPRLVYGRIVLEADEIRFDHARNIATARGHARLMMEDRRLLADEIVYHLRTKTVAVRNLRVGEFPYYLSGSSVEGTRDELILHNASVSYYEPQYLGPSIKADRLIYRHKESIRAENARIGVGWFTPIRFLTYEHALNQPVFSQLDAHAGYRGSLGAFAGVGTRLPVASGVWAGGDISLYSKRGLLLGPGAFYRRGEGDRTAAGYLKTGYIHDYGKRLTDILNRPVPKDRGYIEWTHRQRFSEALSLHGQVAYWSDSEITRDFLPATFYPIQQPDTFLELAHTGDNAIFSVFARAQPNRYYRVQQRLPEVRFDLLPSALPLGIYQQAQASAAVLIEDAATTGETLHSDRFDAYYGLSRPIAPRPWLNLTPVAGARVTHYARATGGKDDYTRVLGEVGFDASLQASAVFGYKNDRWRIDGIRHLVTPRLSYRYIPEGSKGRAYIPPIDDLAFQTYLLPLGLGEQRAIDELRATNTLRLGLDNIFQTRDGAYGSRDLLRVNFAVDFLPDTEPGEKDFSAIHTELAFTPVHWLEFNLYQSVTPQDFTLREMNTGFTIRDGNAWSLYLGNHFLRRNLQEYVTEGRYRLNEVWQTYARLHFDARKSRFIERSIGLHQNINNLWSIRYGISLYNGQRRESKFGFNIQVHLAGF